MNQKQAKLPEDIETLIAAVLKISELDASARLRIETDLRDHFEDGLAEGHLSEDLVVAFGTPQQAAVELGRVLGAVETKGGTGVESWTPWSGSQKKSPSKWSAFMTELVQGARSLRRTPRFSIAVMLTLALGVGANAAVFSVLEVVMLRPLNYEEPERLVRVHELVGPELENYGYLRTPTVKVARQWDSVFDGVATMYTYRDIGMDLTGSGEPQRLLTMPVSAGFFKTLGATPVLGRVFEEGESYGVGEQDDSTTPRVAVLAYDFWAQRLGGDPEVVGDTIQLNGLAVEVVGVMPPGFSNPIGAKADLWTPQDMRMGGGNSWHNHHLTGIARLRPDVTLEEARLRIASLVDSAEAAEPESGEWALGLAPLQSDLIGPARKNMLWVLFAAVVLVLVSACVNAGNLVFARGLTRQRELALRSALGSARARLMTHLGAENLWLAFGGTLLGVLFGVALVKGLLSYSADALPLFAEPSLNPQIFGFGVLVMVVTMTLFGLAPAILMSRVSPAATLGGGRSGAEPAGIPLLRSLFVAAQAAVAVALIVGAGLLLKSFAELRTTELGLVPQEAMTFEVHLPNSRYPTGEDRQRFHERFQERVAALPSVSAVGATSRLPLQGRYHVWGSVFRLESETAEVPEGATARSAAADVRIVAGDTFEALGIELLSGRRPSDIRESDGQMVWISQSVAHAIAPNENAIGLIVGAAGAVRYVAGVVEDTAADARGTSYPTVYVPHADMADDRNWPLSQVARSPLGPHELQRMIANELRQMDQGLVLYKPKAFTSLVDTARAQDRFALILMSLFATLAIVLACAGTYGVLAGTVARRRKEIGIRIALGADSSSVRWSVLRRALTLTAIGSACGIVFAWFGSRWLATMVFGVATDEPWIYVLGVLLVLGLGALAGLVPAQRASKIDPASMLSE